MLENTVKSSLQALDADRQKSSTINDKMMVVVKEAVAAQESVSNLQVKVQTCTTAQEELQRAVVKVESDLAARGATGDDQWQAVALRLEEVEARMAAQAERGRAAGVKAATLANAELVEEFHACITEVRRQIAEAHKRQKERLHAVEQDAEALTKKLENAMDSRLREIEASFLFEDADVRGNEFK